MDKIRAYVACTIKHVEEAKAFIEKLKEIGCEITFDWTLALDEESSMCSKELNFRVELCISGSRNADIFVYLHFEEANLIGSMIELGSFLSVSDSQAIVVTNGYELNSFFFKESKRIVVVPTEEQALRLIGYAIAVNEALER